MSDAKDNFYENIERIADALEKTANVLYKYVYRLSPSVFDYDD